MGPRLRSQRVPVTKVIGASRQCASNAPFRFNAVAGQRLIHLGFLPFIRTVRSWVWNAAPLLLVAYQAKWLLLRMSPQQVVLRVTVSVFVADAFATMLRIAITKLMGELASDAMADLQRDGNCGLRSRWRVLSCLLILSLSCSSR